MNISTRGIVLKDYKLEDDRILTLLTEKLGIIAAYANGANRVRSRLAGSTELLCYSDIVLFKGKGGRYSVDSADLIRSFFGVRQDIEALALASYFSELTDTLATHAGDAATYLSLLLNTLHFLENGKRSHSLLKPLFELRMLTLSGYMPDLVACGECAAFEPEGMLFYPQNGGLLCGKCSTNATVAGGILLPQGILAAMRHIVYCEPAKLFSFTLSDTGAKELDSITEQYLKYQLERTFDTLEFYRSISNFKV